MAGARYHFAMKAALVLAVLLASAVPLLAIKLDLSPQDIEAALAIARSSEPERARFHAAYIQRLDTPFVEQAEIISQFRRVVLIAEERQRRGDRLFAYSATQAGAAVQVWTQRVALLVRLRFHPQNTYVDVPDIRVTVDRDPQALVGVIKEPILALPPGRSGEFVPILGATAEAVFDAAMLGQTTREFVVDLDGREVARVVFDLSAID